jgi:hypothetical protein
MNLALTRGSLVGRLGLSAAALGLSACLLPGCGPWFNLSQRLLPGRRRTFRKTSGLRIGN